MISNLKYLVELFVYLFCLAKLYDKKLKISIHAVVLIILDLILLTEINEYGFPDYLLSLLYLGMFLYGLLYYKRDIKVTLLNCFLAAVVVTGLQMILSLPFYFLFHMDYHQRDVNELIINIGGLFVIFLGSKKIKFKRLSDFFMKRDKIIVTISMLVLIGLGISLYRIRSSGEILEEQYIQIIYFFLIFIFTINEWQKSKLDAEKKKAQLEMNKLYYDAYDQLILLIRERQHDMKNHINAIISMIYTTNSYEELIKKQKEYCDFVIENNEKTKLLLSTENPLIAGFLYSKIQQAEKEAIVVDCVLEMKSEELFIPEYELIEIIGILLDNAIEALSRSEEQEKRIYVSIKEDRENLNLIIANTSAKYDEDMTERFFENGYSSKGTGRGIGLSKLKKWTLARNGEVIVSNELHDKNNYLAFQICLPKIK